MDPQSGVKTLIHELAHELLHHNLVAFSLESKTKELEAESVAFVVARHFGISDLKSPNYIALHGNEAKDILACMDRIVGTAEEIINYVGKETVNEKPNE